MYKCLGYNISEISIDIHQTKQDVEMVIKEPDDLFALYLKASLLVILKLVILTGKRNEMENTTNWTRD